MGLQQGKDKFLFAHPGCPFDFEFLRHLGQRGDAPLLQHGRRAERDDSDEDRDERESDDELEEMIDEAIAQSGAENIRDMGKVMGMIKTKAAGRADMGTVGAMVKQRLG